MRSIELVLRPAEVRKFAVDILSALGMPEDDAGITADSMVWTGLRDAMTHSLIRLDQIAKRARAGGLSLSVDWTPVREDRNGVLLDAGNAWGLVAGGRGMRHAIAKAKRGGVGATSIRNCDNTGAMGWYSSLAVSDGMVGIAITNGAPLMAPWGGAEKVMCNQAFSIGAPAGRHAPVILDMGLGAASLGILREAAATGEPLPPGVAADATGEPTTDGRAWAEGGSLLPMGGHRGYGLALMWEVLTGVLSGGHMLTDVGPPDVLDKATRNSLFIMAIDPSVFLPYEEFTARVDRLIDEMHASPPTSGVERVRVPGERRERIAEQRRREGIPFAADHAETLRALADELGVEWPA